MHRRYFEAVTIVFGVIAMLGVIGYGMFAILWPRG